MVVGWPSLRNTVFRRRRVGALALERVWRGRDAAPYRQASGHPAGELVEIRRTGTKRFVGRNATRVPATARLALGRGGGARARAPSAGATDRSRLAGV